MNKRSEQKREARERDEDDEQPSLRPAESLSESSRGQLLPSCGAKTKMQARWPVFNMLSDKRRVKEQGREEPNGDTVAVAEVETGSPKPAGSKLKSNDFYNLDPIKIRTQRLFGIPTCDFLDVKAPIIKPTSTSAPPARQCTSDSAGTSSRAHVPYY